MGAPVDEAGLAHVEVADDNHLGEAEPVRNMAMLLSGMVTRASSYTHRPSFPVLPHYEPLRDPGQGTGHLLRHAGISVPIAGLRGEGRRACVCSGNSASLGLYPDHAGPKSLT